MYQIRHMGEDVGGGFLICQVQQGTYYTEISGYIKICVSRYKNYELNGRNGGKLRASHKKPEFWQACRNYWGCRRGKELDLWGS